jgi:protein gp37
MSRTKIEWAEHVWNPATGCTPISEGCQNCYAKRMANRLRGRCGYPQDDPFRVTLHEDRLGEPLRWKKPRRVFVCSMGDLFHDDVPHEFIYGIWDVMVQSKQHTFLVLTKRPDRMKSFIEKVMCNRMDYALTFGGTPEGKKARKWAQKPVQNVWLGVTAENQQRADERIPILLQIPAAVRFVSVEPMLGPVDLLSNDYLGGCINCEVCLDNPGTCVNCAQNRKLDWIICGGESGPGARPMRLDWARSLCDQCQAAGVPFFFKQWGEYGPNWLNDDNGKKIEGSEWMDRVGKKAAGRILDGRTWDEYPEVRNEAKTM